LFEAARVMKSIELNGKSFVESSHHMAHGASHRKPRSNLGFNISRHSGT
jgi:hypothetical protein